jgi:cytosine/adenosine deaminase-related metal-dependent hydrolase
MQVLKNALILEGRHLELSRGVLVVKEGRIEKILRGFPPKKGSSVDLKHGVILPPLVNSHTHVGDSILKEGYLGRTQQEVVGPGGVKFQVERLPRRKVSEAIRRALRRMLRSGTLAHCDFREGGVEGVKLLRKLLVPPLHSIILGRPNGDLAEVLRYSDGLGFPSLEVAERFRGLELPKGKFLSVHVSETKEAEESSLRRFGEGEIRRALELNPSFLVHGTWASEEDYQLLLKRGLPIVFCPRANHLLACGSPPLSTALSLGLKFFLGTDNVMVAEPDMLSELSFAWALVRRDNSRAGEEEARKLLAAATIEPALFFQLPWGPIEEGGEATFLIVGDTGFWGLKEVVATIVNRASLSDLRGMYIRGKFLMT